MRAHGLRIWIVVAVLVVSGCKSLHHPLPHRPGAADTPAGFAVDGGGREIRELEVGSSLEVGARGLEPGALYEFRLGIDGDGAGSLEDAVSFARTTADGLGAIDPLILWYQSGVVGCSPRAEARLDHPWTFRTFDEASAALAGRDLVVSVHRVDRGESAAEPVSVIRLPVLQRAHAFIYPSDADGCLLNSSEIGTADVYVSGRDFEPGTTIELAVVPNQRRWHVGDPIVDVTGSAMAAEPERVVVDSSGRFTARLWSRERQFRGTFDVIAHRPGQEGPRRIGADDLISFGSDTALILFSLYPVGGPLMDIAGRPVSGTPYFEFADSFADQGDPVWGALDPTYVPAGHPGGTYAAYYVVAHRDVAGWTADTSLTDVSGGIEIHPVKAGCINASDVVIWPAPLSLGQYDVVLDFGSNPAATAAQFMTDANYGDTVDFLDGATQIGFVVAPDPYALGPLAVGADSYSQDDFFPMLGSRQDVDLRAVVRYPATSAGTGTPVAAGAHPLFIIEHGNHSSCNTPGFDGDPAYDALHTGCPDRERNHEGYMGLLERLASHGIIAVSIDAYDLTGWVPQLIPERSQLILKHLELWSHLDDASTFTGYPDFFAGRFNGHVDLSKISVSGHSRGGEASVGAYMLNTTFSIGSVSSIAPVDGQAFVLPDVPYFVILPAADGDVFSLSGQRIYDRAGSSISDATTKSGIDVYGASHNLFNTVWAADGDDGAPGRDDYIPPADQQRLGEAWLAAWARLHLNGETVYADMFRGRLTFPSFAGRKIYAFHHEKTHRKLESGGGGLAVASGGTTKATVGPSFSVHQTQALQLGWPSSSAVLTYTVPAGERDLTGFETLAFRVAQTNAASNPASGSQGFTVELVGGGNTKATYSGSFAPIPRPYNHSGVFQNVMTSVRIPLHSFIINNSGVTLNDVDTVHFRFQYPSQGEIYVDDVEFSR